MAWTRRVGEILPCFQELILIGFLVLAEPVFSRPVPVSRSRSGTHSSISSGVDTPALSSSTETSSVASESISSIDLSRVNLSLTNMSYPLIVQSRARIRSKGHGHHRRLSISRSSVYETIEEENNSPIVDRFPDFLKAPLSPVIDDNIVIVDPDDASAIEWDERGVAALRRYFSLKDEADVAVEESKQLWVDTPFSIYAAQCTYLADQERPSAKVIRSFQTARPSRWHACFT
jgi:serine/arginine repetitive matrix protein 2